MRDLLRRLRSPFLVVSVTLAACLVLLEVGLRAIGRLPSNTTDGIFEAHGSDTYRLRKNMTKLSRTPSYTCTIHTDGFGLRDRVSGPRALGPEPYYAFLGDSLTFANGVDYEQSFVGVFADRAAARGIQVLNMAVGGHRLSDQEEQLRDFLASVDPKPARVIVVFTAELVAGFEERYTDLIVKNGYLFSRDAWVVPFATVTLGNTSAAYCFFRDSLRKVQNRLFPSGPRAALGLLEAFSRDAPLSRPDVAGRLEARLSALDRRIRDAGAEPVYVYLPSSAELRIDEFLKLTGQPAGRFDFRLYDGLLRRHCAGAAIRLIDLSPTLVELNARGKPLSFMQDMHYNATANHAIGAALGRALLPAAGADGPAAGGAR